MSEARGLTTRSVHGCKGEPKNCSSTAPDPVFVNFGYQNYATKVFQYFEKNYDMKGAELLDNPVKEHTDEVTAAPALKSKNR